MAEDAARSADLDRPDLSVIDTSVPHPARVYDYFLGGTDNFPADQLAAEAESQEASALWGGVAVKS